MDETENEALQPEAPSEEAPAPQPVLYATAEDLLKHKTKRASQYKDVFIPELGAYFRVMGMTFGHHQRIREKCMKVDKETGLKHVDEKKLKVMTILECTTQPQLELKDYPLIEELNVGSVSELMGEIEMLSGLSKIQNIERAFKIAAALERGDTEKMQQLLGVNFSKPHENDSKTAGSS